MIRSSFLLFAFVSTAFPWLKSYEVQPGSPAWSGTVDGDPQYGGVGQTFTANFDSICYCELFVGHRGASPQNQFNVEVWEANGPRVAKKLGVTPPDRDHKWLRFDLETEPGQKFIRGKTYLAKFTRPGDSINYYYQGGNPYRYGLPKVGGTDYPHLDLACRTYGRTSVSACPAALSS